MTTRSPRFQSPATLSPTSSIVPENSAHGRVSLAKVLDALSRDAP